MLVSLSIIIPTYNNLNLLIRCVQSIEKQLDMHDEVIIIDDGSQDGTLDYLLNEYKHKGNFLIKSQTNAGSGIARNNGIIASEKEYIWFIDSDDYIEETSIKKVKDTLGKGNYDLLYFDYKMKTKKGLEEHQLSLNSLTSNELLITQHYPWNKIIKRELMNDIFFPNRKIRFQDHATIPVVVAKANKIGYLAESLYIYDFSHLSNVSKNYRKINDMYIACDYLIEYFKKGIFSSEEIETILIKSLIFYKMFDQPSSKWREIIKDLKIIRGYLDLNVPNWKNSKYITFRYSEKYVHLISNIYLKIFIANIFKKSTLLSSFIIFFMMKIKKFLNMTFESGEHN